MKDFNITILFLLLLIFYNFLKDKQVYYVGLLNNVLFTNEVLFLTGRTVTVENKKPFTHFQHEFSNNICYGIIGNICYGIIGYLIMGLYKFPVHRTDQKYLFTIFAKQYTNYTRSTIIYKFESI